MGQPRQLPLTSNTISDWRAGSYPRSRRRAGSSTAPSRGILLTRNVCSILLCEGRAYHSNAVFITAFCELRIDGVLGSCGNPHLGWIIRRDVKHPLKSYEDSHITAPYP